MPALDFVADVSRPQSVRLLPVRLSVYDSPMLITVRLFASYAEAAGTDQVALELPAGSTAADCLAALRARVPSDRLPPKPLIAVNHRYSRLDQALGEGDEVALIPPVAGG